MDEGAGWFVVGIVALVVWVPIHIHNLNKQIDGLKTMVTSCGDTIDEANQKIEEQNSSIDDAKSNAWLDYYSMGDALDRLDEGEMVSNDCYVPTN